MQIRPGEEVITLPFPPSANNLFINVGKRRVKSKKYRDWIDEAGWRLTMQKPQKFKGKVKVSIYAARPDKRKRDIANLEKAVVDLLVAHLIIRDDSLVETMTLGWVTDNLKGVSVTITAIEEDHDQQSEPARTGGKRP